MSGKWWFLGLLVMVCCFAALQWRPRLTDQIPAGVIAVQVAFLVGLAAYTAYRFVA